LLGTLGSGLLYTYAGPDALRGLAACFVAGTVSSFVAALLTLRLRDEGAEAAGLRCGPCVCVAAVEEQRPTPAKAGESSISSTTDAQVEIREGNG